MTSFNPTWITGLDWTIRASLIFAVAGMTSYLLRNRSAATRHLVWSAALVGTLYLPLAKWSLPGWDFAALSTAAKVDSRPRPWLAFHRDDVESSLAITAAIDSSGQESDNEYPASSATVGGQPDSTHSATTPVFWPASVDPIRAGLILWSLGLSGMLLGILAGAVSLWRLLRSSQPFPVEMAQELAELTRRIGLRRHVAGRLSTRRVIPMTWGTIRPVVMLPVDAVTWTVERRQMVLLHELAHVQRWDFVIQLLGQVSRAAQWFNPLAWWALSRLRLEQERACDDFVLNAGASAAEYATELVTITARVPRFSWDAAVALAIRRFANIEQRLLAILDMRRDRRPLGIVRATSWIAALSVGVSLVAVPRWPTVHAEEPTAATAENDSTATETVLATQPKAGDQPPTDADPTLTKVRDLIRKESASETDAKRLTEAAIKGMLESLQDPHSALLTSDDFREFQIQVEGQIVGIGAHLTKEQDEIVILATLPNSPAAKAGLQPKDVIVSVGGTKVRDLKGAVEAIRGKQGSEVKLQIRRAGKESEYTITRDVVVLSAVRGLTLDAAGKWRYELDANTKTGYLQIGEFNHRTATELETALADVQAQGLKGLVLDLRGCPGGLFDTCVKVASQFLKSGTVATIRGRQPSEQKFDVDGTAKFTELPLVILVDDQTASAAEVFVAALQDHNRGVVIGERTFGKGSVQTLIPVSELQTSMRLTTAQMFRPNGKSLNRTKDAAAYGVDPNEGYFIPLTTEQRTDFRERRAQRERFGQLQLPESFTAEQIKSVLADPALAAAFECLAGKLKTGEFTPTGRSLAEMKTHLDSREKLRAERDQLLEKLQQIDKQLGNPVAK